jgi:hypothetical protein
MHFSTSSSVTFHDTVQVSIREPELSFCFCFFVVVLQMHLEALNLKLAIYTPKLNQCMKIRTLQVSATEIRQGLNWTKPKT